MDTLNKDHYASENLDPTFEHGSLCTRHSLKLKKVQKFKEANARRTQKRIITDIERKEYPNKNQPGIGVLRKLKMIKYT